MGQYVISNLNEFLVSYGKAKYRYSDLQVKLKTAERDTVLSCIFWIVIFSYFQNVYVCIASIFVIVSQWHTYKLTKNALEAFTKTLEHFNFVISYNNIKLDSGDMK